MASVIRRAKLYVGGASSDLERAELVLSFFDPEIITFDWTKKVREERAAGYAKDSEMPWHKKKEAALECWRGATECDVMLALLPSPGHATTGLYFEQGSAWTLGRRIICAGPERGIFHTLSEKWFAEDMQAIAATRAALREVESQ